MTPPENIIPYGTCHCGCGENTKLAPTTNRKRGWIQGQPVRFVTGHNSRMQAKIDGLSNQERYQKRLREKGLCVRCAHNKTSGRVLCESCRIKILQARCDKTDPSKRKGVRSLRLQCAMCATLVDRGSTHCAKHRTLVCQQCKCDFIKGDNDNPKFCSRKCQAKWQRGLRGDKARNWRGGRSSQAKVERGRIEYKEWRDAVFRRDDWTCQICKKRGDYLHAHHIKEFAKYPALRTTLINGQTLCRKCHRKVHSERMKKNAIKKSKSREIKQYTISFIRP